MDLISIIGRERTWYMYRGECRHACGGRWAECNCTRHVAVDGSVSARMGDMTHLCVTLIPDVRLVDLDKIH